MIPANILANEIPWGVVHAPNMVNDAVTDPANRLVIIDETLNDADKELAFYHEIGHVLKASYKLPSAPLDEEGICENYMESLWAFMRRNARVEWIDHDTPRKCKRKHG